MGGTPRKNHLCEEHAVEGFVTASSITDIFYLTRKGVDSLEEAYEVIGNTLNLVKVLTVTDTDVSKAFEKKAHDFEDCLMATCALSNKCDAIVTRNGKDFEMFGVTLYTPTELLAIFDR